MQSFTHSGPVIYDAILREAGLTQTGPKQFVETYIGENMRDNYQEMDRRAREMAAKVPGVTVTCRAKIGRNAPCPCGSGSKFKKCCIGRARYTG